MNFQLQILTARPQPILLLRPWLAPADRHDKPFAPAADVLANHDDLVAGAGWPDGVSFDIGNVYHSLFAMRSYLATDPLNERISYEWWLPFTEPLALRVLLNQERTGSSLRVDAVDEIVARWLDAYFGRVHLREYRQVPSLGSLVESEVEAAVEKKFIHMAISMKFGKQDFR